MNTGITPQQVSLLGTKEQINVADPHPLTGCSWWPWIWLPLCLGLGIAAAAAAPTNVRPATPSQRRAPDTIGSLRVRLISSSRDQAGTWGVFAPALGLNDGNGPAITNDWTWKVTLRLDTCDSKFISRIAIFEKDTNQVWSTVDSFAWPLVVFHHKEQLNHNYGEVLGPFETGAHQLELYGQVDNRQMHGTDLLIEFTDGTSLGAQIPPSETTVVE